MDAFSDRHPINETPVGDSYSQRASVASMFLIVCLITIAVLCEWGSATASRHNAGSVGDQQCLMRPFVLTRNDGQWDSRVQFFADAGNARIWLTSGSMNIQVSDGYIEDGLADGEEKRRNTVAAISSSSELFEPRAEPGLGLINLAFIGTNPDPTALGESPTEFAYNYFSGSDPDGWHANVPNYRSVLYRDAYDGIDLRYLCTNSGEMQIEFTVSPGADVSQIGIALESTEPEHADPRTRALVLASRSDLIGSARVSQVRGNRRLEDVGRMQYGAEGLLGVQLGDGYDDKVLLIVSATLDFSTYLGGTGLDQAWDVAVDDSGYIYVTGSTMSSNFPMENAKYPDYLGDWAVFVTKMSPSGDALIYSTFLQGSLTDHGRSIAVDRFQCAYVTGSTEQNNDEGFPVTPDAYQSDYSGEYNAFLTKLSPNGDTLVYSTLLGGSGNDLGYGIVVDSQGRAVATGYTTSSDFPTPNGHQTAHGGGHDAYVVRLSASGSILEFGTYLGGSATDDGRDVALDENANIYVTGLTQSGDFPFKNALDAAIGGSADAFVSCLSPNDDSLIYSTYLGGADYDEGFSINADAAGNAYVTGTTGSSDFPTQGAHDSTLDGSEDAFVTKLTVSGLSLAYSTYLGGGDVDHGLGIAVDASGCAYVTGGTASTDFPTEDPYDGVHNGGEDAFITQFSPDGMSLVSSTYLGGSAFDCGNGIAVGADLAIYAAGETQSSDFPTQDAFDSSYNGDSDAFVVKFETNRPPIPICCDSVPALADANCEGWVTPDDVDCGSYDPDGDPITFRLNPPPPYPLGATIVWLVVEDDKGAKDSCEATVTVEDTTPPVAECPDDITQDNDPGACGAVVTFSASFSDNCPGGSIACSPASGSFFPVGTTQVECIAIDASGNADTCTFNVTVEDNEPPTATCPGDITQDNDLGECGAVVTFSATFTDNCAGGSIACTPASGSSFPVGTTQVESIAVDASGNADTCTFSVTVEDSEPPVAQCPTDTVAQAPTCASCAVIEFTANAEDNCPGATIVCDPPSGFCFAVGTTDVSCIASDAAGNQDTCSFNVTVDASPCDTLWIEPPGILWCLDSNTYVSSMVGVHLKSYTPTKGGQIPVRYDPLPEGWLLDSVSFSGTRLEACDVADAVIDRANCTILVYAACACDFSDSGPLFYVWFSNPTGSEPLPSTICFDTTTVVDSASPKPLLLSDCSNPPRGFTPVFEGGCGDFPSHKVVDLVKDCVPNILDVVCFVDEAFRNDTCEGRIFAAADLKCDGVVNVLDVVLAVNCVFRGGTCVELGCGWTGAVAAKRSPVPAVSRVGPVARNNDKWEAALIVDAPLPWAAAQLEWTFEGDAEDISITVGEGAAGLEPFWHLDDNEMTVGLIDIYGETIIEPGESTVLHLSGTGEFPGLRLASGLLATEDAEPILISPAELAGTDAAAQPSTFELGNCYPNPFNAGTVIPYTLAEDGQVRLEVFDVLGRQVAALVDEFQSAGRYDIAWNGLDDRGQPLASGMYFYRLTTADIAETKKMVLLK